MAKCRLFKVKYRYFMYAAYTQIPVFIHRTQPKTRNVCTNITRNQDTFIFYQKRNMSRTMTGRMDHVYPAGYRNNVILF